MTTYPPPPPPPKKKKSFLSNEVFFSSRKFCLCSNDYAKEQYNEM